METKPLIFSLVGSTASGKTALALRLAEFFAGQNKQGQIHLLSADSRQVYSGLEILSAADIPKNWQKIQQNHEKIWQNPKKNIFLHGVSLIDVTEDWSAAHFYRLYENTKKNLGTDDVLIIVGGTAFYQKQLQQRAESLFHQPNLALRAELNTYSVEALQSLLQTVNPKRFAAMNQSDRANPRRLIRAIELGQAAEKEKVGETSVKTSVETEERSGRPLCFLLPSSPTSRQEKIQQRLEGRFAAAQQEVAQLLPIFRKQPKLPAFSSTGFLPLAAWLMGEISQTDCRTRWFREELQYAKRQDLWWKQADFVFRLSADPQSQFLEVLQKLKKKEIPKN